MDYFQLKKAELHCHLDGSLDVLLAKQLLEKDGHHFEIPDLISMMQNTGDCKSLDEYLEKFDVPLSVMQTADSLRESAYTLGKNAAADGVNYIEVRFAPSLHRHGGLHYPQIIEAVIEGMFAAKMEFGIEFGVIACAMRQFDSEKNIRMLTAAREFLNAGLVACDLAGGEVGHATSDYAEVFDFAKRMGLPFTIHAGEQGSVDNVIDAIKMGASRIGHGIAVRQDESVMEFVKNNDVLLELCPTSNIQTKAVSSIADYPILEFLDKGIKVSISTDNRTVSGVTLSDEYELLHNKFHLSQTDFDEMYVNAIEKSFASDDVKNQLLKY